MARISIYVPCSLKNELACRPDINLSAVAQEAFRVELKRQSRDFLTVETARLKKRHSAPPSGASQRVASRLTSTQRNVS